MDKLRKFLRYVNSGGVRLMEENRRYSPLKAISLLMALDAAGAVALLLAALAAALMETPSAAHIAQGILIGPAVCNRVRTWSVWSLRALVWSLILACLTRLTGYARTPGFRKARVWYLWRLLTAVMEIVPTSIAAYICATMAAPLSWFIILAALLCSLMIGLLGETVMQAMGIRYVLQAGAELLDACGMEEQAGKNRRCGKFILGFAAARLVPVIASAVLAVWACLIKGSSLIPGAEGLDAFVFLAAVLFLLSVPAGVGGLLFQFAAAVRVGRTYRAIEDLTK